MLRECCYYNTIEPKSMSSLVLEKFALGSVMKYVSPLTPAEIQTVQEMHHHHPSRRARMRAHSILLSHHGYSIPAIANMYQIDRRSVSAWLDRWQALGLVGLFDQPRCGRPPILTEEEQQRVQYYLTVYPKDLKKVAQAIAEETSKPVSTKTIKRLAKKTRHVWKRIKKGPAKKPDPHLYQQRQAMIARLQRREAAGEMDLYYFDATGFCLEPCVPYAWQPIGAVIEVPATKSARLNVLGFLNRHNALYPFVVEGKVDTAVIVACFDPFCSSIDKKTVVLLDNGPVHTSKDFIRHLAEWVSRGLIIKYLPPYAPELNLIELLWRFIKYKWLPFSAYASFPCLRQAVEHILTLFGAEYKIAFQVA